MKSDFILVCINKKNLKEKVKNKWEDNYFGNIHQHFLF